MYVLSGCIKEVCVVYLPCDFQYNWVGGGGGGRVDIAVYYSDPGTYPEMSVLPGILKILGQ